MTIPCVCCFAVFVLAVNAKGGVDTSPLLHAGGIQQHFEKLFANVPTERVQRALATGLRRAALEETLDLQELSCDRDYSQACPPGWIEMDGKCNLNGETVSLAGMTPWEKAGISTQRFPCRGECEQDHSARCPDGWAFRNDQSCHAPINYSGSCVGAKDFTYMGYADKRSWSLTCGVSWPCRASVGKKRILDRVTASWLRADCASSYKEDCPAGWILQSDGRCHAPLWVPAPRCGFIVSIRNLSPEQRRAWSIVCNAPWPCIDTSSIVQA